MMAKRSRRVQFELHPRVYQVLAAELQRRGELDERGAFGRLINEWLLRDRVPETGAIVPASAPAPPPATCADDDFGFDMTKVAQP